LEELTSEGSGNLAGLVSSSLGSDSGSIGFPTALRLLSSVLVWPFWWVKPSFKDAWLASPNELQPAATDLPSTVAAVVCLIFLASFLVGSVWVSNRRHRYDDRQAVGTAIVSILAGLPTAASVPVGPFGIAPHQFRWLWPLAAFTTFTLVVVLIHSIPSAPMWHQSYATAAAGLIAGLAILNLAPGEESATSSVEAIEIATHIGSQMGVLEGQGPVLVRSPKVFNDPYATAVMAELQSRRIPFLVERSLAAHLGEKRVNRGQARAVVAFSFGPNTPSSSGGREIIHYRSVAVIIIRQH
jgi:hypothetical protein